MCVCVCVLQTVQENLYKQWINGIIGREGENNLKNKTARALSSGSIHAKRPENGKTGNLYKVEKDWVKIDLCHPSV